MFREEQSLGAVQADINQRLGSVERVLPGFICQLWDAIEVNCCYYYYLFIYVCLFIYLLLLLLWVVGVIPFVARVGSAVAGLPATARVRNSCIGI